MKAIVLLSLAALGGCSVESYQIETAAKLCADHSGIFRIKPDITGSMIVRCNDGTVMHVQETEAKFIK